MLLYCHRSKTS